MKNQALFSSKDKSKKLNCRLQQFLFGALMLVTAYVPAGLRHIIRNAQAPCGSIRAQFAPAQRHIDVYLRHQILSTTRLIP